MMEFIHRRLKEVCQNDLQSFPILTVTGPRQSGKSTLLRHMLPDWKYVNLEEPSWNEFASEDPKGFLKTHANQIIFDEVQRAPHLLSWLQVEVDRERSPGRFALSGSNNLLLLEKVSQSLAGRTAIRNLLPFSFSELKPHVSPPRALEEQLFYGGYAPVLEHPKAANAWLDSYIQTYIERDVRLIRNITDLGQFRRFLKLCAGRAAQLWDASSLGRDVGVSHNTIRDWLSVLEAGFIAFRLEPYFKNFSRRVIKSPKLYFYDTGVLCRLLGLRTTDELSLSPFRGAIFENHCVVECLKTFLHQGHRPNLYFWKDKHLEVDILVETGATDIALFECKSAITPPSGAFGAMKSLEKIMSDSRVRKAIIYGGDENQIRSDGDLLSWSTFCDTLN